MSCKQSVFCCLSEQNLRGYLTNQRGKVSEWCISIIIYPLTARVVGAPQMILQPVSSIFPCSLPPSGTWRTPDLSIPWCCLWTVQISIRSWDARTSGTSRTRIDQVSPLPPFASKGPFCCGTVPPRMHANWRLKSVQAGEFGGPHPSPPQMWVCILR